MFYNNRPNIEISGFSSNIKDVMGLMRNINDLSSESDENCTIQLLDSHGIAGKEHICHATLHALNAFERNENIANDLGLEICVRASAQRQISKALDLLGIKTGDMDICAVFIGCNEDMIGKLEVILGKRHDEVLKPDEDRLKRIYNVSEEEIETAGSISNAMVERTALLILEV